MISLQPSIDRIKALLKEDTDASVTYAALEARLALERVCYDRLRQRHDYISHEELRKWQPGAVMNKLISDVDAHAAETIKLSMSTSPARPDVKPEDQEYIEIGTEIGFNVRAIVALWNALSRLALHLHLPVDRSANLPEFGERSKIRSKVNEVIVELERLSRGTMTYSGFGMEVSFVCTCGTKNKRRASLLQDGQHVICIDPTCHYTWKATKEEDGFGFEAVTVTVPCTDCQTDNLIPWRFVTRMKYDEVATFSCHKCQHQNTVRWHLMQARQTSDIEKRG